MEEKGRDSASCGVEKERGLVGLGFTLHFFQHCSFSVSLGARTREKSQVAHTGNGWSMQGQVGWHLEQPGIVEHVPAMAGDGMR